jgi:hypothetical protein
MVELLNPTSDSFFVSYFTSEKVRVDGNIFVARVVVTFFYINK